MRRSVDVLGMHPVEHRPGDLQPRREGRASQAPGFEPVIWFLACLPGNQRPQGFRDYLRN